VESLKGAVKREIPLAIQPMLAVSTEKPFNDPEWLFEIKWDGYRALSFIDDGNVRLVSRNQNDLSAQFSELQSLPSHVKAKRAILDGEVVAVDEEGRASFSLMQQRTGFRKYGQRAAAQGGIPIMYYVFDLIYADGYDLRKVSLEDRKAVLQKILVSSDGVRYSDHYAEQGLALFEVARQKGLEGIVAKRRQSCYEERRTREWMKIKITKTLEAVIGGYTEPEGSRKHFGSLVLGLYNDKGQLVHVGQAGTGFDQKLLKKVFDLLKLREVSRSPFHGSVDAKKVHWIKPELVGEIKFGEWTHETSDGGLKLRAPVFMGLRDDKDPKECTFEQGV
jgi:bifunctional non-homologous end joining protein LigD